MRSEDPGAARAEWRRGWPLVLAAAAGTGLSPLMVYPMGLFIGPLEAEFGWSRTLITSGLLINSTLGVMLAPVIGILIDRFGPRRIAIPGALLFCIGFAALGTVGPSPVHWWSLWLAVAIGSLLIKPTVWTAAVASRFNAARGLALALVLCGASLNGALVPSIAGYLIENYGWRWGYAGLALIFGMIALPLLVLFFYGALDLSRTNRADGSPPIDRSSLPGMTVQEAFRSRQFYQLALASALIILTITTTIIHFVPLIIAHGIDRTTGAALASAMGGAAVAGRLTSGSLLDRFDGTRIGGMMFAMPAIAFAGLLMFDGSLPLAIFCALVIGISVGAEMEIASYLSSRYFGMRNFGTLFGIIVGLISLASGVGPLIASHVHDRLGSYDLALMCAIPMSLAASALIFTLGRYPDARAAPLKG